jgi:hypothetical protein
LEAWVVEYSRNIGRLIILWRCVLFVFIALDLVHPSVIYDAGPAKWMGVVDKEIVPMAVGIGVLLAWTVIASLLETTWDSSGRPVVLATPSDRCSGPCCSPSPSSRCSPSGRLRAAPPPSPCW